MVGLVEDTGNAFHLNTDMVNKALPKRLVADGAITSDGPAAAVA